MLRLFLQAGKLKPDDSKTLVYLFMVFPGIRAIIGLGLLARLEFIRGIVNFVCGLSLIFGLFGLLGALLGTLASGAMGLLFLVFQLIDLATNAGMIYLIGETDGFEPRFT